jgi:hypothetical protein
MRACFTIALLGSALALAGCSLATSFDDFNFGHRDAGSEPSAGQGANGDGGMQQDPRDASAPIEAGQDAGGTAGGGAVSGGRAGDGATGGMGGVSVPAAGSGGAAAASCRNDSECPDPVSQQCRMMRCVLRRLPYPAWVTGGGGITRSSSYQLQIGSGAPQPSGVVKSQKFSVSVGVGAGRP